MDLAMLIGILVRVFLVVTMLSIGLRLGSDRGGTVAPLALARLGVANLVLVPVVAVVVCRVLALPAEVTFAILAMAVAPAGSLGPKLVQVARGDLALGVVATFVLSAVATLTVAPSLALASALVGLDATVGAVDAALVVGSLLVFQLAPLLAGVLVARRRPALVETAGPRLTRLSTVLLVLIVTLVLLDGWDEVLALGPIALGAVLLVIVAADGLGWLSGGGTAVGRRTGAILTGQRSGVLALLVVGPGAPIASATVVAFALLLLIVNATVAVVASRPEGRPWPRGVTT